MRFLAFFFVLFFFIPPAQARVDLLYRETARFQDEREIRLDVDSTGNVVLHNLPVVGEHIYSSRQQTLYVRLPDTEKWYFVPLLSIQDDLPLAELRKIGVEGAKEGADGKGARFGVDTMYWKAKFSLRTCARLYTSREAGHDVKLNASDVIHLNALLGYLYAPPPERSCHYYRVSPAAGKLAGLPIHVFSATGESKLAGVIHNTDPDHILPKEALPLDVPTHILFLKSGLSAEHRQIFEQTTKFLTPEAKVKVLYQLLSRQLDPGGNRTPPQFPEISEDAQ